ncbi:MAG: response regulator [Solirubrobacterales bacterium]
MSETFEHVRLVIADPTPMVRQGLRTALFALGFRSITDISSFTKLHDIIEQDAADLIVTSSALEGNDCGFLIQENRNQRLGANPFVMVIVLLANAEPDYVKRVIDSGSDDLLLTPVAPDQLILRIERLSRARKPFVITHDYTGPDRRVKTRTFDSHSAPMMEVPNLLRLRMTGVDGIKIDAQVREAAATLNRIKIERHAVQLDWLVSHISASVRDGMGDGPSLIPHTHRLVTVAEDMVKRMQGTPAEGYISQVAELLEGARKADADPTAIAFADLERMHLQSKLISRSLGNPQPSVAVNLKKAG